MTLSIDTNSATTMLRILTSVASNNARLSTVYLAYILEQSREVCQEWKRSRVGRTGVPAAGVAGTFQGRWRVPWCFTWVGRPWCLRRINGWDASQSWRASFCEHACQRTAG